MPSQTQRHLSAEELENPLLFSVNDNPCAVLVSPPLAGSTNYRTWSIFMRIALEVKNKWSLNGSITPLSRDQFQYAAWRRCNLVICSWLFESVHHSLAHSVMHFDKAKDGTMSMNDYYTKCRTLWEEMNTLRPIPLCKCDPRCSCDFVDQIRTERDIDKVIRFLQGLNDDYNGLKSIVLVLNPLPELYKVFVMDEKLERQITLNNLNLDILDVSNANAIQVEQGHASDELVAASLNSNNGRRSGNTKAKCTFCGMTGHTVDKCYMKHGYPRDGLPGYKSKGEQQQTTVAVMNMGDQRITSEQLQKIISILQPQASQTSGQAPVL
ncbi:PREDICTED: uncharacterized protein LOC109189562 [Ipomoea nil]|uniref:uncharacterized protein LOC109189562 n=1 Tax=Ipomoea nil TaxID=35883 RepID=UPI000900EDE1|nr:PREDICTED: uncharacterized protein LOC109189562 [Ipomoea nil]